jgi:hypothetical protein
MEHMYNRAVLPASTASPLITGWYKAEHLNGYFMRVFFILNHGTHV